MIVVQFNAAFFGKGRSNITSNANNNNSLEKLAFMRLYRIVKYVHAIYMHIYIMLFIDYIIQWLSRYSIIHLSGLVGRHTVSVTIFILLYEF